MNSKDPRQENKKAPVVTFSNIPLDDETPSYPVGYDALPAEAMNPQSITVVDVQFKKSGKLYYFDPGQLTVQSGDEVIIDTARGAEYGFCINGNHKIAPNKAISPLRRVIRVATDADKRTRQEYKRREADAFSQCQKKILEHQLDMKLVSAEYSFDGSRILFYFTADGRVDFRDLVKDLAGVFHTRIELRQIGVRDEAKMLGGLGICGRPFCCKQFLDDFQPVSIKMAKTQSLSLNPTKISGTCGRLMCCLQYEQDAYESLIQTSPKAESIVNTCDGVGTVTETNLLQQTVKVRLENDPNTVKCYHNCDICILRNGKGRKSDPPIPADLPPLPKREDAASEPEEIAMFDETALSNFDAGTRRPAQKQSNVREKSESGKRSSSLEKSKEKKTKQKPNTPKESADAKTPREGRGENHRRRYRGKKSSDGQSRT